MEVDLPRPDDLKETRKRLVCTFLLLNPELRKELDDFCHMVMQICLPSDPVFQCSLHGRKPLTISFMYKGT